MKTKERIVPYTSQGDISQSRCPVCGFANLSNPSSTTCDETRIVRTKTCPQCESEIEFEFTLVGYRATTPRKTAREHHVLATLEVGHFDGQTFEVEDAIELDIAQLADSFHILPERLCDEACDETTATEWQLVSKCLATNGPDLRVDGQTRQVTSWPGPVRLRVRDESEWLDYVLDRADNDDDFILRDLPNVTPEEAKFALENSVACLETREDKTVCVIRDPESGDEVGWFGFDERNEWRCAPDKYLDECGIYHAAERVALTLCAMHYEDAESNRRWRTYRDVIKGYKVYVLLSGETKVMYR